jgi:small subunit ribosomal protein S6
MRTYEVVLILQADLDEQALTAAVEKTKTWITDAGGNITKVENWGKRHLAYMIRKQREGHYVLIEAEFAPTFTAELDRNLRYHEPVIRFMITSAA